MEDLLLIFFGLLLGLLFANWGYSFFRKRQKQELTEKQSVILLEKIQSVCKLITVEGEFAEIFHYENTRSHLFKLLSSKKKALIVINAKAHIGFDMRKIKMHANTSQRLVVLTNFPRPEVLSVEPDLRYYDLKNGLLNRFDSEDLTALHQEAKNHILEKIPNSGLMETAGKEALEAVLLIEKIVETIGWKLDYKALTTGKATVKLPETG
ncbi:DUF4230 domain-containing protein [Ascidiimonas aurantiaca]|uniref:DUF4230 domain-containing protein n=1 Tax=Ascidiimonas aurantiaca TaxID=1685432 RepID=UPI0030EC9E09